MNLKKGLFILVCLAFSVSIKNTVFAGVWEKDTFGWKYQKDDGNYARDNWKEIDENWYYFDSDGYMKTGWISSGKDWYYCGLNGSLAVNQWIGDYYVGKNGNMLVSTTTPDGYEVGADGRCTNRGLSSGEIRAFYQQKLNNWKSQFTRNGFYYDADYIIQDINQDGIEDLLLLHTGWGDKQNQTSFNRAELYTVRNGKFILTDNISSEGLLGINPCVKDGNIILIVYPLRYLIYIYSITPSLQFMQELYYVADAENYEAVYENINHIFEGYTSWLDIQNNSGEALEMEELSISELSQWR